MLFLFALVACGEPTEQHHPQRDSGVAHDPPDEAQPTVKFLSPGADEVVTGVANVEAEAVDDVGVARLALDIDQVPAMELSAEPWSVAWDTTAVPDGPHRLHWVAHDAAHNEAEVRRTVVVQNGIFALDNLQILEPAADEELCGSVRIEASGSREVVSATLFIDGTAKATRTEPPYRWTWDTTGRGDRQYDLAVVGTNAEGNSIVDREWVTVNNAAESCDPPPTIDVVEPTLEQWVAGNTPVSLDLADAGGTVTGVRLDADGVEFASLAAAPWDTTWDVTALSDGPHELTATATDDAGHEVTTQVRVQVDQTPPRARFLTPANHAKLVGTVAITADVTDDNGIASAEVFLDGASLGKLTTAPWTWSLDTTPYFGDYKVEVEAYDLSGQRSADSVDVFIDNPPALSISAPADGDILSGAATWLVSASDDSGVLIAVEIDLDGAILDSDRSRPYKGTFDTCELESRAYTLTATALDAAGLFATESIAVVVDQAPYVEHEAPAQIDAATTFLAFVADDVAVTSVEWEIDGTSIGTTAAGTAAPRECDADCDDSCVRYSLDYDASALADGAHTLVISATNADGVVTTSTVSFDLDRDSDGDGYDAEQWGGTDCDDGNNAVSPNIAELCDSADQDCDGFVDEDFDADGDGFTDRDACPSGEDCDDTDGAVNPDATEVCDGVDNDCDDTVDVSGPPTAAAVAFATGTLTASFTDQLWGNVYTPSRDMTLVSFAATFDPGTSSTIYSVFEADSVAGPFELVASSTEYPSGAAGSYASSSLDVPFTAGKAYFLGIGSGDTTTLKYERAPTLTEASAVLPVGAIKYTGGATGWEVSETPSTNLLFPQTLSVTWVEDDDADLDGDGENVYCGDCDDADDTVASSFAEACDGVDNNCDLVVPANEVDADGDGAFVCGPDCDDADPARYPNAVELCDGVDNDCDGLTTEEVDADGDGVFACQTCVGTSCTMDCADDDTSTLIATFYADADGDGYGDPATASTSCPSATGSIRVGGDCDDDDATLSPGATELCNSADDNCDGVSDEGFDVDGDGVGACDDCDDAAPMCRYEGETAITDADVLVMGDTKNDRLGVVGSADVDRDGWVDVAFGTPDVDNGATDFGSIYLIYGPVTADTTVGAGLRLLGESTGDKLGSVVSLTQDLDGDGAVDLLAASRDDDDGGTDAGAAYVVLLDSATSGSVAAAGYKIVGERKEDYFGTGVAALHDLNGDDNPDMAIGAPLSDSGATNSGTVYVVFGPLSAGLDASAADLWLAGENATDYAGYTVADGGDLDGDGLSELLVGAPRSDGGATDAGVVYIVADPAGSASLSSYQQVTANTSSDMLGNYLDPSPPGDVNGDGLDDLVLASPNEDSGGASAGAVWVFYGPVAGSPTTHGADATVVGAAAGDLAGYSTTTGDVDLDGANDILIGAPYSDGNGAAAGAVYLVYGPPSGTLSLSDADAVFYGESPGDHLGTNVHLSGDVDGDGASDLWMLANGSDLNASDAGTAYLFHGGP